QHALEPPPPPRPRPTPPHPAQNPPPPRRLGVAFKPHRRQRPLLHLPQPLRTNRPRCALYHDHWPLAFAELPQRLSNFTRPSPMRSSVKSGSRNGAAHGNLSKLSATIGNGMIFTRSWHESARPCSSQRRALGPRFPGGDDWRMLPILLHPRCLGRRNEGEAV